MPFIYLIKGMSVLPDPVSPIAITITFDLKSFKGYHKPIRQLIETCDLLRGLRRCSTFTLYPELTLAGNIHYHGFIYVEDRIKWYRQVLPNIKLHGFVCIKEISDYQGWRTYASKDQENMTRILKIDLPLTESHPYMKGHKVLYREATLLDYFQD